MAYCKEEISNCFWKIVTILQQQQVIIENGEPRAKNKADDIYFSCSGQPGYLVGIQSTFSPGGIMDGENRRLVFQPLPQRAESYGKGLPFA